MAREKPFFPIKLTSHDIYNYQQWRSSCLLCFQSHDCSGILDGTEPCPPVVPSHPHFQNWYRRDQRGLEWLKASLSQGFLNRMMVKGIDSSHKLWLNVHNHFANLHHSDIYQIKSCLHNVKKEPTMSINDYLTAIKILANELKEAGAPLEDHDIVYAHILTGLPDEYNSFCRDVMSLPSLVPSEEVEHWLLELEKNHQATQPLPPPSATLADLVAHNSYHQRSPPLPLDAVAHNSHHQPAPPPAADVVAVNLHHQPSPPPAADVVAVNTLHQPSPPPSIQEDAEPAIGIDLGTTYSRVAVWHKDHVEIILNDYGNRKTASFVAFTDADETLVGDAAFNQVVRNTANTIFDTKRLIGRRFSDSFVQNDVEHWPFKVIEGAGDKPMIVVTHNGEEIQYNAEQISSMILSKMRKIAETFLGSAVKKAVISVPAFFNDEQRRATISAGTSAGLNVLRIINESSAAAIDYGIHKKADWSSPRNVIIFDLGGGTLDVSLLTMTSSGEFQVKATAGDTHLGGEDFDNRMVEYCVEEFKKEHGFDITKQFRALRRLKKECEKVKKRLSSEPDYDIEVDCLYENKDFTMNFTREKFEQINLDLFQKCMEPVNKCLKDAKLDIINVDDVILAGGSSRIPKVQELLQEVFKGKELCKGINPDEGVVYGAAAQAALLSGNGMGRFIQDFNLKDVTPFGICFEVIENHSKQPIGPIHTIRRNRRIPYKIKFENQDRIAFRIYEGEKERPESLNLLGECNIVDHKFDTFLFQIDANGILSVFTSDKSTGQKNIITINGETTAGRNDNMAE